jgi:hypothetical protein
MHPVIKSPLAWLGLALGVACQGTIPPTEPHVSPDGAPSMSTNDAPAAGPLADEGLASPPDTLPGPGAPISAKEPAAGGSRSMPPAPGPGPGPGGGMGGSGMGGRGFGGTSVAGSGIR